jgi:hypothetical protein
VFIEELKAAYNHAKSYEKEPEEETKEVVAADDKKKAKKPKASGLPLGKGTRQFLDFLYTNSKF